MVLTVDYYAWQKWRASGNKYLNFLPEYGSSPDFIPDGYLVCQIYTLVSVDKVTNALVYALYAESETEPASLLVRCKLTDEDTPLHVDVATISADNAQKIHLLLADLPAKHEGFTEFFPLAHVSYSLHLELSKRYGGESYHWTESGYDFSLSGGGMTHLRETAEVIIAVGEKLTGNKSRMPLAMTDAQEGYHEQFLAMSNHQRYTDRWLRQPLPDLRDLLKTPIIDEMKWLDYRFYLAQGYLDLIRSTEQADDVFTLITMIQDFGTLSELELMELDTYLMAVWRHVLAYYPPLVSNSWTLLNGIVRIKRNAKIYIDVWQSQMDSLHAQLNLADYIIQMAGAYLAEGKQAFIHLPPEMRAWLSTLNTSDYFTEQYIYYTDTTPHPMANSFSEASDRLDYVVSTWD